MIYSRSGFMIGGGMPGGGSYWTTWWCYCYAIWFYRNGVLLRGEFIFIYYLGC